MAKQLTVKAILQYPEGLELGSSPDVRRFKVPKGSDSDGDVYRHLVDTLPTVFPDISGLNYSLFWKGKLEIDTQINRRNAGHIRTKNEKSLVVINRFNKHYYLVRR